MSAIILDEEVIHYEVLGRGRPLIFVHGWLGSWRYWIPTMQALSGEYRAYALDLWGFGDTTKAARHYTLDEQAELLGRFMEQLGIARAAFVGHGLGAAVALRLARRQPEVADRVMGVGLPLQASAMNPRLLAGDPVAVLEWLLGRDPGGEAICREAAKADPAGVATMAQAVQAYAATADLAELERPYLLVYGDKDPLIAPPDSSWPGVPGGNVHVLGLEESRHFPMLDETAKFNRLLVDFLALKSGESLMNLALKEEWTRRVR